MRILLFVLISLFILSPGSLLSQKKKLAETPVEAMKSEVFDGLKFRNIGPAFMSGRIADIAIDPTDQNTWYVAVGSGGVWKTVNAGTTFSPVFDKYGVYSTGCITVDPSNPNVVWLGTGENVGGRHASFGDGIYKSEDGGQTWVNHGLLNSERISKIIVHPSNSDVLYVASQGPLWASGGERGFYKTIDGGKTWRRTLGDNEWLGVTDIAVDPRDPDRIYAATWARHRTVAALMDGSESTRMYVSEDGGENWQLLKTGLPEGKWGKIGLAVSPIDPDVVYAAIELDRRTGGVWRSSDRGASWNKMSNTVAGATGPHYYQELYACPHNFDRLYLMNNALLRSDDGGRSFFQVNERDKHGDNHSINFRNDDPDYLLVGTDGGVYETFDLGKTWRFMENIPVTQYYKLAVDDAEPFYNIYGGTQDNSTQGGPSRTDAHYGIRNADWKVVLNWDGHQPATEPGNPDIIYGERQEGHLSRIDISTGEVVDIQPQAAPGEPYERFNWDAPILVSPHSPTTIYFASQRVWRSENRGDQWTAISGDLTRNQERLDLPIMGKKQSWDSPWDVLAMSNYNTITSLAESPIKKGLIYAGTDDGLLQVTEDGGANWRKIEVSTMGVPATAFINDVKADLFDENTVYVALDNHKYGDFKPYLVKSTDKGKSWTSMTHGIPDKHLVWRVVQDHVDRGLMFAGTEFGLFFTSDGGRSWTELNGGIPTISFRDLAIQRRENDLVAASFGRGFFILDDYTALRGLKKEDLELEAKLYMPRKAWWYFTRPVLDFDDPRGSQGSQLYLAPNPDFGAVFSYYLKDEYPSAAKQRKEKEKKMEGDIPFPGWDSLEMETRTMEPYVFLEIRNSSGEVVNRIKATNKKGFQRVSWDLKVAPMSPMTEEGPLSRIALMAAPGTYTGQLFKFVDGQIMAISEQVEVLVEPLREGALPGAPNDQVASFWRQFEKAAVEASEVADRLTKTLKLTEQLHKAALAANVGATVFTKIHEARESLQELDKRWNGYQTKNQIGEKNQPTVGERLFAIDRGVSRSTYGPTSTHRQVLSWAVDETRKTSRELEAVHTVLRNLADQIVQAGGPKVIGLE